MLTTCTQPPTHAHPLTRTIVRQLILSQPPPSSPSQNVQRPYYAPYPNQNVFDLDSWYWAQHQKSQADFLKLTNLIGRSTMAQDIEGVNWTSLWHELGSSSSSYFDNRDSWKKGKASINIPSTTGDTLSYSVDNIFHKSLTEVIRARFESPCSKTYHYIPHRLIWQRPHSAHPEQDIYGELYNSTAWMNTRNYKPCRTAPFLVQSPR